MPNNCVPEHNPAKEKYNYNLFTFYLACANNCAILTVQHAVYNKGGEMGCSLKMLKE